MAWTSSFLLLGGLQPHTGHAREGPVLNLALLILSCALHLWATSALGFTRPALLCPCAV